MTESIAIVGAGSIGATIAFGLLCNTDDYPIKEILLVDMSTDILQGQTMDLADGASFDTVVRGATFKEAGRSSLIIITVNAPQLEDEPCDKWMNKSDRLIEGIITSMQPIRSDAFIIVVAEPVDFFINKIRRLTTLKNEHVMGIGYMSIYHYRFAKWIEECYKGLKGVPPPYITRPYVIGSVKSPLIIWPQLQNQANELEELKSLWINTSMFQFDLIKEKKGDAWYGVSSLTIQLFKALFYPNNNNNNTNNNDHASTFILSTYCSQFDICTSLPVYVNNLGVSAIVNIGITETEKKHLISTSMDSIQH